MFQLIMKQWHITVFQTANYMKEIDPLVPDSLKCWHFRKLTLPMNHSCSSALMYWLFVFFLFFAAVSLNKHLTGHLHTHGSSKKSRVLEQDLNRNVHIHKIYRGRVGVASLTTASGFQ